MTRRQLGLQYRVRTGLDILSSLADAGGEGGLSASEREGGEGREGSLGALACETRSGSDVQNQKRRSLTLERQTGPSACPRATYRWPMRGRRPASDQRCAGRGQMGPQRERRASFRWRSCRSCAHVAGPDLCCGPGGTSTSVRALKFQARKLFQ